MCIDIQTKKNPKFQTSPFQPYMISYPCGKCPLCLRKRLSNWIFRIEQEQKRSLTSNFITFTYNDANLPHNPTQAKRSFQLFVKRLRKHTETQRNGNNFPLRYILRSEYGEKHGRLHLHAITFNFPDYKTVEQVWGNGFVTVSNLTTKRIKYTFKYLAKDLTATGQPYPNFQLTSRGIGANYLTPAIKEYHNRQIENCYIKKPDGHTMSIPKYYKNKLYDEKTALDVTTYQQHRIDVIQDVQIANLMYKFRIDEKEARQKHELSKLNATFEASKPTKL
jgi:hypothetical protein